MGGYRNTQRSFIKSNYPLGVAAPPCQEWAAHGRSPKPQWESMCKFMAHLPKPQWESMCKFFMAHLPNPDENPCVSSSWHISQTPVTPLCSSYTPTWQQCCFLPANTQGWMNERRGRDSFPAMGSRSPTRVRLKVWPLLSLPKSSCSMQNLDGASSGVFITENTIVVQLKQLKRLYGLGLWV